MQEEAQLLSPGILWVKRALIRPWGQRPKGGEEEVGLIFLSIRWKERKEKGRLRAPRLHSNRDEGAGGSQHQMDSIFYIKIR